MKLSRNRKNARLAEAGKPHTPPGDLETPDPEWFVLETLTKLKQVNPEHLTPDLRQQVEDWTPPRFRCLSCRATGLLSTCPRIPNREWRCPQCQLKIIHDPVS